MQVILDYLKKNKRINVEKICSLCDISRDTARRDLVKLEKNGVVLRTHGGAILPTIQNEIKNYKDRLHYGSEEKKEIGKLASSLIKTGEKIIMDTSTTVQACAEFLDIDNCSVVTNSINVADILSNKKNVDIYLVGGQLNQEHRYLYGSATISMLSNYYAHKAFIGVGGITQNGLTVVHEEDGFVMKKMVEQAEQVIVLADHSKFGKNTFFKFADLSQIDLIITDKMPNKELMEAFNENEINVILPKK
jgi:DeoR/GlpR family transcriptional regulator of sugar metabolism